jgi:hypothetical protein
MIELGPQAPPAWASVSAIHWLDSVLHPTMWPRSHCSSAVQAAPTWPATAVMHVDCPVGQTVPALHAPRTHGPPAAVGAAQIPQIASTARAQNVLAHCASSPHAAPTASAPGTARHAAPKSPCETVLHESAAIDCAQAVVEATVALLEGAPIVGTQPCATRRLQVAMSP